MNALRLSFLFVFACAILSFAATAHAAQPFAMPGANGNAAQPGPAAQPQAAPSSALALLAAPLSYAMRVQQSYYRSMAGALRAVNLEHSVAAAWTLATLSFAYGIFHAVGPGHGKVVVSSYLLADERDVRRGILIAFLSSFAQALTAIIAVGALAILLGLTHRAVADAVPLIERASFVLVTGLGGWLLWRAARRGRSAHRHDHVHAHEHAHDHEHEHEHAHDYGHHDHHGHVHLPTPQELRARHGWRAMAAMILAVGLRPCTGAILVLLFALTQGAFLVGALSTFAMSIGTAITVSTLAILTLASKALALRIASTTDSPWAGRIERGLEIGGGLFIMLMGLFLLLGSFLAPAQPLL